MEKSTFNEGLLQYLQQSPTPFHAVNNLCSMLKTAGFVELEESESWTVEAGGRYFVTRNDSALVAFKTGAHELSETGVRIVGTHTDSPCLKIKPTPEIRNQNYVQLGVEIYGGALLYPWYDRDLSIAGRVDYVNEDGKLRSGLVNLVAPVAFIPSLAIHLDREANSGRTINPQKEMPPILLQLEKSAEFSFDDFLLRYLREKEGRNDAAKVLSHELLLYDTQPPALVGLENQFIASARLDNLLSCYLGVLALINSTDDYACAVVCNDHEEVGSVSSSGAQGPFLKSVLQRLVNPNQFGAEAWERVIRQSLLWSIDNSHGVHPNFANKHDDRHSPLLNAGPAIKINANQRYASNSQSVALFKSVCDSLELSYQSFVMRSDLACGSTIGPITAAELGINTLDLGVPTFGMHSVRELAGADDGFNLARITAAYFNR